MGFETAVDNYLTSVGLGRVDYYWQDGKIICSDQMDALNIRDWLTRPASPVLSPVNVITRVDRSCGGDMKWDHLVVFAS